MVAVTQLPLATVAASQFRARQQRAREVVRNRGMSAPQAERHLRPWLAIACLCGADLPDLAEILTDRRNDGDEFEARWLAAYDICPRPHWVPILAAARDDAFNRYLAESQNPALTSAAAALQRLCLHLRYDPNGHHVPAYRFAPPQAHSEPGSEARAA